MNKLNSNNGVKAPVSNNFSQSVASKFKSIFSFGRAKYKVKKSEGHKNKIHMKEETKKPRSKKVVGRKVVWLKKIKLYFNYVGCWFVLKLHLYDNNFEKNHLDDQLENYKKQIIQVKGEEYCRKGGSDFAKSVRERNLSGVCNSARKMLKGLLYKMKASV